MLLSAPIHQLKRRARLLAREQNIPLHAALDRIARDEGFARWSLLATRAAVSLCETSMLARLSDGDLLLLGARPGHGKTLMGLKLLVDAVRDGRRGVFFTLEYTGRQTRERLEAVGGEASGSIDAVEVVTSDDICAEYIIRYLASALRGTVAVVDYLQILDQRRNTPELALQIDALKRFAQERGIVLAFISQIDRSYDPDDKMLPDMADIRLPNRLEKNVFSKACFLHEGRMAFQALG